MWKPRGRPCLACWNVIGNRKIAYKDSYPWYSHLCIIPSHTELMLTQCDHRMQKKWWCMSSKAVTKGIVVLPWLLGFLTLREISCSGVRTLRQPIEGPQAIGSTNLPVMWLSHLGCVLPLQSSLQMTAAPIYIFVCRPLKKSWEVPIDLFLKSWPTENMAFVLSCQILQCFIINTVLDY